MGLMKHGDLDYRTRSGDRLTAELWSHHGRYYVLWSDDIRTEIGDAALIDAIADLLVNHPRLGKTRRKGNAHALALSTLA